MRVLSIVLLLSSFCVFFINANASSCSHPFLTEEEQTILVIKKAIKGNDIDTVKLHIHQVRINFENTYRETLLHVAINHERLEIFKMLIELDASVSAVDKDGNTPAHMVAKIGNLKMLEILIRENANMQSENNLKDRPIHEAARYGQKNIIERLKKLGVNLKAKNAFEETPYDLAVKWEHKDILHMLN